MQLLIDGRPLMLNPDTEISLELKSPLFADEQPGAFSYPFNLPICSENATLLGFTHVPNSAADRLRNYDCILTVGSFRKTGILQAREVTEKEYICNLIFPPANVPEPTWKRRLQLFDFGTVKYNTIPVTMLLYGNLMPDLGGSQFRTTVRLYLNNEVLMSYTYSGISPSGGGEYLPNPFWSDFAGRVADAVNEMPDDTKPWGSHGARFMETLYDKIQGYTGKDLRGYIAQGTEAGFSLSTPKPGTYKITYQISLNDREATRENAIDLPLVQTRLLIQNPNGTNLMQNDHRYCMPMMKNSGWYESEQNKSWNGYVNHVTQSIIPDETLGGFTINQETGTRYSLSPAIRMKWAIQKTCEILGYRIVDRVFTNAELNQLILWVNKSLDELIPNTITVWNQYAASWKIADHLPNLTMKEWVDQFGKNLFFRPIFYPDQQECVLVFLKDILSGKPAADWTAKLTVSRKILADDNAPVQLAFKLDGGDELSKKENATYAPVPADSVLEANPDTAYQKIELPFSPVEMETKTVLVNKNDPTSPYYSRSFTNNTATISITPVLKQRGISPLFNQSDTAKSNGRLMFAVPRRKIPSPYAPPRGGDSFPGWIITTGDNQTENYSLLLDGEKGVISKFGRAWLQLIARKQTEEFQLLLTPIDLANFRWEHKYYLNGLNYLVEKVRVTFDLRGIKGVTEVTTRRC